MQTAHTMDAAALHIPAGMHEVWWLDSRVDVKLTASQTDGRAGMWIWVARRGAASPLHMHHREDEQFLVIEGQARFTIGQETLEAEAGDLVLLPREVPHTYVITSDTARLVGTATPGGFEQYFTDLGTPVMAGAPEAPPPTIEAMAATAARYGIEILGPPPTLD